MNMMNPLKFSCQVIIIMWVLLLTLVTLLIPPSTLIAYGDTVEEVRAFRPNLIYRPKPNHRDILLDDPRQEFNSSKSLSHQLDQFFDENYDAKETMGYPYSKVPIPCNYGGARATSLQPCRVNLTRIHPECSKNNRYGYAEGKPCVLLMLERVRYFTPRPYKNDFLGESERTYGMQSWLVSKAHELYSQNEDYEDTVWISCEGIEPWDREAIGPLKYYAVGFPNKEFPGIPAYYFPYSSEQSQYRDPFVFVKFENVTKHVTINVKCSPWAYNLSHDERVMFRIRVD